MKALLVNALLFALMGSLLVVFVVIADAWIDGDLPGEIIALASLAVGNLMTMAAYRVKDSVQGPDAGKDTS